MRKAALDSVQETSEIKSELLALTGSTAGYNSLMSNIERQLAAVAQVRGRLDLKTGKFISKEPTSRKRAVRRKSI